MTHTAIPTDELKVFASLKNVRVVFDIGARDDVDYLILKPNIKLHAFEPNPVFFAELEAQIGGMPNVFLNNFGLGDVDGEFEYNESSQAIGSGGIIVAIKTLDEYVKKNRIKRIDFLKTDTEGYDYLILSSSPHTVKLCRYIQYEGWDNDALFRELLKDSFELDYIGGRNTICTRKGEKKPWLPDEPKEGGLAEKTDDNRLRNI
jgi:FkbM family methyltransferase